jgi:hypothetical protein
MFGGLEMTKKKMGGLGKLSQFSGIKSQQSEPEKAIAPSTQNASVAIAEPPPSPVESKVEAGLPDVAAGSQLPVVEKKALDAVKAEKPAKVNIEISKTQKEWLAETASQVRENNTEPVPPSERVYPQHLIGVAIDLLRSADVEEILLIASLLLNL